MAADVHDCPSWKLRPTAFLRSSIFQNEETARISAICKDEHSSQLGSFHIMKWDYRSVRFAVDPLNAADVSFLLLLSSFFFFVPQPKLWVTSVTCHKNFNIIYLFYFGSAGKAKWENVDSAPSVNPDNLSAYITWNWHVENKQNLDKNRHSSAFRSPVIVSLGCKLPRRRRRRHPPSSAGRRQSVFRPLPRATGSQLSRRVITQKPRALEWSVKYGHRPHRASTRQQVNWPRRPLKIWACNISSDWICIKASFFCAPGSFICVKIQESGAFWPRLERGLSMF